MAGGAAQAADGEHPRPGWAAARGPAWTGIAVAEITLGAVARRRRRERCRASCATTTPSPRASGDARRGGGRCRRPTPAPARGSSASGRRPWAPAGPAVPNASRPANRSASAAASAGGEQSPRAPRRWRIGVPRDPRLHAPAQIGRERLHQAAAATARSRPASRLHGGLPGGQHVPVVERLGGEPRGEVGDQRDAEDLGDRGGARRWPRARWTCPPGRRPGRAASGSRRASRSCRRAGRRRRPRGCPARRPPPGPQARAVEVGEVREAGGEVRRRVAPRHRARAGQVEVVADRSRACRARSPGTSDPAAFVRSTAWQPASTAEPHAVDDRGHGVAPRRGARGPRARARGPRRRPPSGPSRCGPAPTGAGKPGSSGIGTLARVSPRVATTPPIPTPARGRRDARPAARGSPPRRPARRGMDRPGGGHLSVRTRISENRPKTDPGGVSRRLAHSRQRGECGVV